MQRLSFIGTISEPRESRVIEILSWPSNGRPRISLPQSLAQHERWVNDIQRYFWNTTLGFVREVPA